MNQSDMILEFIDGTLDGGNEQTLFDEMAQRPELRAELRQYVMIGDAVRADREAFSPPADVERRLLGGLGFFPLVEAGGGAAAAGAAVAGGTVTGTGTAVSWFALTNLKSVLLPLVVGLLLGVVAGGGGVYVAMDHEADSVGNIAAGVKGDAQKNGATLVGKPGSGTESISSAQIPSAQNQSQNRSGQSFSLYNLVAAMAPSTVPSTSSQSTLRETSLQTNSQTNFQSGVANVDHQGISSGATHHIAGNKKSNGESRNGNLVGNDNGSPKKLEAQQNPSSALTLNESSTPSAVAPDNSSQAISPQTELRSISTRTQPQTVPMVDPSTLVPTEDPNAYRSPSGLSEPIMEPKEKIGEKKTFAIEFRKGVLSQPFADNNARPVESQFFGNFLREDFAAAAYYLPNRNWYLGLEGGRERFTQTLYYNQDEIIFVEQRPAIAWVGGTLGRNLQAFGMPFFVQGTVGSSQYGWPIARGRAGLDLLDLLPGSTLSSTFSIPLSFEATSLAYTYNGQYLVTGNWGFNIGARLQFGF